MARRMFTRTRDGRLVVALYEQDVELLTMTARDMTAIVEEPPDGQVRDRLYPRAYLDPTEEKAQGEYDALVHDDLVHSRRAAFEAIVDALGTAVPNPPGLIEITPRSEGELQWGTAVNGARLGSGTGRGASRGDGP